PKARTAQAKVLRSVEGARIMGPRMYQFETPVSRPGPSAYPPGHRGGSTGTHVPVTREGPNILNCPPRKSVKLFTLCAKDRPAVLERTPAAFAVSGGTPPLSRSRPDAANC